MNDFTFLDISLKTFSRTAEDFNGENLDNKVDFLLTDLHYNSRIYQHFQNLSHDKWTADNISHLVKTSCDCLMFGIHGHKFCSYMQFWD